MVLLNLSSDSKQGVYLPSLPLSPSFHEDVPKDYRQVSLTAVKQRFEDERYEEIGKEEVLLLRGKRKGESQCI